MPLDLRLPLGSLFAVLGAVLAAYGWLEGGTVQAINVNLVWGLVLGVFGAGVLALARRRT